jgi:hypothetical protein
MASPGSGENHYWPGFVDALTNVVIAMIFVIVVLAIALSFAARLAQKRLAEEIAQKHIPNITVQAAPTPAPAPVGENPAPTDSPQRARIPVRGAESAASAAGGRTRSAGGFLQLDFEDTALTLDADALAKFKQALATQGVPLAEANIHVEAVGPGMQLSENQRSAFLRVMSVRNVLLDQGVSPQRISVRIATEREAPKPSVLVTFKRAG